MILNTFSYLHPEKRTMDTRAVDPRHCILQCSSPETARLLSTDMHRQRPVPGDSPQEDGVLTLSLPGYSTVRLEYGGPHKASEEEGLFSQEESPEDENSSAETAVPPFPSGRDLFHMSLGDALQAQEEGETLLADELAPLIDSGDKDRRLADAVRALDEMAVSLGRGNRPGAFLAVTKEKIHQLATEKKEGTVENTELISVARTLKDNRERLEALKERRRTLQAQVDELTRQGLDRVEEEIAALVNNQEQLEQARHLSSDQMAELNRMTTLVETARRQLEKTSQELELIREELRALPAASSEMRTPPPTYPNALERNMRQLMGKIVGHEGRLDEVNQQVQNEDMLIAKAQVDLTSLPDFTREAPNPIVWYNQLLQSFKSAVAGQEREAQRCQRLEEELEHFQRLWDVDGHIFEEAGDFTAVMVENEQKRKAAAARYPLVSEEVEEKQNLRDDRLDYQNSDLWLTISCFILTCGALGCYFFIGNRPLLIVAGAVFVVCLFFFSRAAVAHSYVQKLNKTIAEGHAELALLQETMDHKDTHIEELMVRLGCQTPRELEARYDRYKELTRKIAETGEKLALERALLAESEERIPALFARLCDTLSRVDEIPESAAALDSCVGNAISKYHRYKDMKRRLTDRQNHRQTLFSRKSSFEQEITLWQNEYASLEEEFRTLMRDAGFTQESLYSELDDLCSNFRSFLEDAETSLDQGELLARQQQKLQERIESEKEQLVRYEKEREYQLEKLEFPTLEEARKAGELGAEIRAIKKDIEELTIRKNRYLQGTTRVNGELLLPQELAADGDAQALRQLTSTLNNVEKEYATTRQLWQDAWARYNRLTTEGRDSGIIEEELACTSNSLETAQQLISAGALTVSLIQESLLTGRPERCSRIAQKATELLQSIQYDAQVQLTMTPEGRACLAVEAKTPEEELAPLLLYTAVKVAMALVLAGEEKGRQFIVDAAIQLETVPMDADAFYTLLEALPTHWQTLVITENMDLAETGKNRGWARESL